MENIKDELQDYSCIVRNKGVERVFTRRGVIDLFEVLRDEPELLRGATIIDKVIGKGAAALMVLGGVSEVKTPLLSEDALRVLRQAGVKVEYEQVVPHIINRTQTDMCPLEKRCQASDTPAELLPVIAQFIEDMKAKSN